MKIGIAIVHFGEQQVLDACLASLPKNDPIFNIEIFDCNKENIGFTAGNNKLIQKFLSNSTPISIEHHDTIDIADSSPVDWLWLLNDDTSVPEYITSSMVGTLSQLDSKIGIIGFQIRSIDNPDLIHHAGTYQCYPNGIHKSGSVKLKHHTKRTFEKWVTFASVLIRREVFEEIGLLDKNFFHICSDSDFCYRARAAGWKIVYEPSFIIYHKIGSSAKPNPEIEKFMISDTIWFQNKWLSGKLFLDLDKELIL